MEDSMIANLATKTGKTLDEWIAIVKAEKLEKHTAILKFLKTDHGFTHGYANLVSLKARASDAGSVDNQDDLITGQYKGKESLKSIYDQLITHIQKFGSDVEIAPKKAYVSIRRKKQFAIIQPSTKTRVDVGINIKGKGPTDRLEKSGSFNAMVSHRVRVTQTAQVDDELIHWVKEAYENAG